MKLKAYAEIRIDDDVVDKWREDSNAVELDVENDDVIGEFEDCEIPIVFSDMRIIIRLHSIDID